MVGVHNGIIENYQELKNKLLRKGYEFYSSTDTEVAVKLIDYYYKKYEHTPVDAINHAMVRIRGSYALAVMFQDYPGEIYVARKDSPMIIGVENGDCYVASDVPAILKYTRNVYYIGNLEMARLANGTVTFYNLDGDEIEKKPTQIKLDRLSDLSGCLFLLRGVKVALDCANGSSWNIAKAVFDALGAKTYVINAQPDGTNINNNAGSTHIGGLQKYVVENGMDVGFAYDGDADRCLCVDEKGNVITGDHILYIYGKYMKERGKLLTNTVVTTVMSNFGLYKAFDELGIDYAKTAVGDKYVYEYMMKNGCRIGGEQSGHIIFSKYASTGDGILTSLKIMEVMMARKKKLSELAEGFTVYPQVLTNVRVTDKKAAQDDADVQAAVKKVTEELGDTGRILVRESGTEPVVRVMVEAESEEICQKYVDMVVNVIKENGYVVG